MITLGRGITFIKTPNILNFKKKNHTLKISVRKLRSLEHENQTFFPQLRSSGLQRVFYNAACPINSFNGPHHMCYLIYIVIPAETQP